MVGGMDWLGMVGGMGVFEIRVLGMAVGSWSMSLI